LDEFIGIALVIGGYAQGCIAAEEDLLVGTVQADGIRAVSRCVYHLKEAISTLQMLPVVELPVDPVQRSRKGIADRPILFADEGEHAGMVIVIVGENDLGDAFLADTRGGSADLCEHVWVLAHIYQRVDILDGVPAAGDKVDVGGVDLSMFG